MYISTWPSLNPAAILPIRRERSLPFPLTAKVQTRFFAARYGIYHLFRVLRKKGLDSVLVPSYHHGNEVKAIRAAEVPVHFYSIDRNLRPDLEEVERSCANGARALYIIHYMGWPQPLDEISRICSKYGVLLIEDCALSLLSEWRGCALGSF